MSNVSNRHQFKQFTAGKSTALSGQRLAKIGYKNTEKNKAKYQNAFVSVPFITDDAIVDQIEQLIPHIKNMMEENQDALLKTLYEQQNGNLENGSVSDDDISVAAVIGYMNAESTGGRMTKESIEFWFTQNLHEPLIGRFNELGIEGDKCAQMMNAYKGMFSALSGGATVYPEDKVQNLLRALEFSQEDVGAATITGKLKNRLQKMNKKDVNDLLVNL